MGVANQLQKVVIFDMLDFVGQTDEAAVDFVERAAVELIAQLFAADGKRVTAGMLAQHEFGIGHAYRLRRHDFICQRIFEHAILVDSGLMCERIASDDGFIGLHGDTGNFAQHLAGGKQVLGRNGGLVRITVADAHASPSQFLPERRFRHVPRCH